MQRLLFGLLALWLGIALTACGGDESAQPQVTSFTASAEGVPRGTEVVLTAVFTDGTAMNDQGIGEVLSGVPVAVRIDRETVFTITVTNADGAVATQTLRVGVVLLLTWNFDVDAPGWTLGADPDAHAEVRDGALEVSASQFATEDGRCLSAGATLVPDDALLQSSSYTTVEYILDFRYAYGTGTGYPEASASYAGRSISLAVGDFANTRVRIVFDRVAGKVMLYEGSDPVQVLDGSPDPGPAGLRLSASACAADLESADISLDTLTVSAR